MNIVSGYTVAYERAAFPSVMELAKAKAAGSVIEPEIKPIN